ncbi:MULTISPECIES: polysaccharide deacetylase family protein [unclassified Meiothermus]|uniref:polysaccharide deacetylase family protein n=1 Tax=unclassified Meiothermus TaxID=370471 RepID=UPI0018F1D3D7|nr:MULTISPECIES: polysaccharide deacetylase family protein [unclassified Meiothermus]
MRLTLISLWCWLTLASAGPSAPLPDILPAIPGETQPTAPGTRPAQALPQLELTPPIPEVQKVEYASNGFIEVAHALVLMSDTQPALMLRKAQQVVAQVFLTRSSLSEVDISLYRRDEYAGFGGPLPRLTASVPRARLDAFERLTPANLKNYDRLWLNPRDQIYGPFRTPTDELESSLQFQGSSVQLKAQRLEQAAAALQGGVVGNRLYHGNPALALAALTFDDAPHPLYAPLLLDTLRRAGVKATFFCIGRNALAYPYFVRDMVRDGHEIGNHTFHHVRLNTLDKSMVLQEIQAANQVLERITGRPIHYFRPPGGRFSPTVLEAVRELNMTIVFWTDDPGDFQNLPSATLENRLERKLRQGGIVLLHDNVLSSIEILPDFLRLAERRGIRLGTVEELVQSHLSKTPAEGLANRK